MRRDVTCSESHNISKEERCTSTKKCINCHGEHSILDKSCPKFVRHAAIIILIAVDNISFSEARRLVDNQPTYGNEESRYVMKNSRQYPPLPARDNIQGFNKKNSDTYSSRVISQQPKLQPQCREVITYKNSNDISRLVNLIFDSPGKDFPDFSGKNECLKMLRAKFVALPSFSSERKRMD